jgi:hypothetical protein
MKLNVSNLSRACRSLERFLIGALATLVAGCAHVNLTYDSFPPKATVYENNLRIGRCPFTRGYQFSEEDKKRGGMNITGLRAEWPDGRSSRIERWFIPGPLPVDYWEPRQVHLNFHAEPIAGQVKDKTPIASEVMPVEKSTRRTMSENSEDARNRLEMLKRLRDGGILTDEEYRTKRQQVIEGL